MLEEREIEEVKKLRTENYYASLGTQIKIYHIRDVPKNVC